MVTRNNKNAKPVPAPRTGGESNAVPGVSVNDLGDGTVTVPLGRDAHHGNRPERNVALEGDTMQRFVGGGSPKEHEYRDAPTAPDADEGREQR